MISAVRFRPSNPTKAPELRFLRLTEIKTTNHPVNPENPVNPVRLEESTNHEGLLNLSAVVL